MRVETLDVEQTLERLASTYVPRNRPWTDKEARLVLEYYRRVPLRDLCAALGRSQYAIRCKAQALGMAR